MNFGDALERLKTGAKIYRAGWYGKHHLVLHEPSADEPSTQSYIVIVTQSGAVVPWLASQADVLAEDWGVDGIGLQIEDLDVEQVTQERKQGFDRALKIGFVGTILVCVFAWSDLRVEAARAERDAARADWCSLLRADGVGPDMKGSFVESIAGPPAQVRWVRWCLLGPGDSGMMTDAEIEKMRLEWEAFEREYPASQ